MGRYLYHLSVLAGGLAWMLFLLPPIGAWWSVVVPYGAGVLVELLRDLEVDRAVARHPARRGR